MTAPHLLPEAPPTRLGPGGGKTNGQRRMRGVRRVPPAPLQFGASSFRRVACDALGRRRAGRRSGERQEMAEYLASIFGTEKDKSVAGPRRQLGSGLVTEGGQSASSPAPVQCGERISRCSLAPWGGGGITGMWLWRALSSPLPPPPLVRRALRPSVPAPTTTRAGGVLAHAWSSRAPLLPPPPAMRVRRNLSRARCSAARWGLATGPTWVTRALGGREWLSLAGVSSPAGRVRGCTALSVPVS